MPRNATEDELDLTTLHHAVRKLASGENPAEDELQNLSVAERSAFRTLQRRMRQAEGALRVSGDSAIWTAPPRMASAIWTAPPKASAIWTAPPRARKAN